MRPLGWCERARCERCYRGHAVGKALQLPAEERVACRPTGSSGFTSRRSLRQFVTRGATGRGRLLGGKPEGSSSIVTIEVYRVAPARRFKIDLCNVCLKSAEKYQVVLCEMLFFALRREVIFVRRKRLGQRMRNSTYLLI